MQVFILLYNLNFCFSLYLSGIRGAIPSDTEGLLFVHYSVIALVVLENPNEIMESNQLAPMQR